MLSMTKMIKVEKCSHIINFYNILSKLYLIKTTIVELYLYNFIIIILLVTLH